MARIYSNFLAGEISNNPLSQSGTTLNGSFLVDAPVVSGGNILKLVLDPQGLHGAPEIVYVTSHSSGASSATIQRGREGTAARQHPQGTRVVAGVTATDLSTVESNIGILESAVSSQAGQISSLQGSVSDLGDDIGELEGDIAGVSSSLAGLSNQVNSVQTEARRGAPIGSVMLWAGSGIPANVPAGWLLCLGQELSRTQYADLFAVIGTQFGNGDGSTTFKLPSGLVNGLSMIIRYAYATGGGIA